LKETAGRPQHRCNDAIKRIQRSRMGGRGRDSRDLGRREVVVFCGKGIETSGFIKWEDIFTLSGNTVFLDGFCSMELVCWLFVRNNNKNNKKQHRKNKVL